jgi:glucokinase
MTDAIFAAVVTNRATQVDAVLATPAGDMLGRRSASVRVPLTTADLVALIVRLASELQSLPATEGRTITGGAVALESAPTGPVAEGWDATSLGERLTMASGFARGVTIDTATNAALLGEMTVGAGRGATSAIFLDLSRSVSAALCINGHLVRRPQVGALGHIPVAGAHDRCACGGRGHLETIASAQALVRQMIGLLVEAPATEAAVMQITGGRAEALTAPQIWQLACEHDPSAVELMARANAALADVILTLLLALDAERIILGGALARSGTTWRDALAAELHHSAPPGRATELAARLVLGELGQGATMRGTLALAGMPAVGSAFGLY